MVEKIEIIFETPNRLFREAMSNLVADEHDFVFNSIQPWTENQDNMLRNYKGFLILDNIKNQSDLNLFISFLINNNTKFYTIILIKKSFELNNVDLNQKDNLSLLQKPICINWLFSKIRTEALNFKVTGKESICFGESTFYPKTNSFQHKSGKLVGLTSKECKILSFLYQTNGTIVSKEILLREIWGYKKNITTHTLETHIYRLRQKIEVNPKHPKILVTDYSGYYINKEL